MRAWLPALVVLSLMLAGCGGKGGKSDEIVVQSTLPTEVRSDGEATTTASEPKGERGHLSGLVVDEAIRPIEGATAHLPGLDLKVGTDRDGHFGFTDLRVGSYFVTVEAPGYYGAETTLEVKEGDVARAKFVLTAMPPPEPFHVTVPYQGFSQVTSNGVLVFSADCTCTFGVDVAQVPRPDALVIEATMAEPGPGTLGQGFYWRMEPPGPCCPSAFAYGDAPNPMRLELRGEMLNLTAEGFTLDIQPTALGAPELNKAFDVYVTAFYNGLPPDGWSFVNGDP